MKKFQKFNILIDFLIETWNISYILLVITSIRNPSFKRKASLVAPFMLKDIDLGEFFEETINRRDPNERTRIFRAEDIVTQRSHR